MSTSHSHHLTKHPRDLECNSSPIEKACSWVCDKTGSPMSLVFVCIVQIIWIIAGEYFKFDPYPFSFLLTVSNIIQLILIFVLAVGQRQSNKRASIQAEADHHAISYILHHQDLQEKMLDLILKHLDIKSSEIEKIISELHKK